MVEKQELLIRLHDLGAIGILRLDSEETCLKAIDSLFDGGLCALEVTMTVPQAFDVVRRAKEKYGESAMVGVGTVLDSDTAEKSIRAGAQFIISPSLDKEVVEVCKRHDVISCPGTFTTTEIVQAQRWGADLIKVFPISQVGPGYIKAILAPLPSVRLVPTGGIRVDNAAQYIASGAYCLGVGEGLASRKSVSEGHYDLLAEGATELLKVIREAKEKAQV